MPDPSGEQRPLRPPSTEAPGVQHPQQQRARPRRRRRTALCSRSLLRVLVVGQLLSLLVTGSGVFSQLLAGRNANIPTSQSALNYLLLSMFLIPQTRDWWRRRRQAKLSNGLGGAWQQPPLQQQQRQTEATPDALSASPDDSSSASAPIISISSSPSASPSSGAGVDGIDSLSSESLYAPLLRVAWWKYLILAVCDVEGNFLLVKAYEYTSITSVQLLDCFTIPVVMVLSRLLLHTIYNRKHLLGAFVCLVGLTLLIASDILSKRNDQEAAENNKFLGDMLVLLGCCCYAVSNLGQEYLVKTFDRLEFLGMLGLCGTFVSAIQIAAIETDALKKVEWTDPVVCLYIAGFNSCLFMLYYLTPILLQHSSALFLNLSLLTSDFWSILFAVLLFRASLHPLYFLAFSIIIVGLLLYNLAGVEWSVCGRSSAGGASGESEGMSQRLDEDDAAAGRAGWMHVLRQVCGQAGLGDEEVDDDDEYEDEEQAGATNAPIHRSYHSQLDTHSPSSSSSQQQKQQQEQAAGAQRWHE